MENILLKSLSPEFFLSFSLVSSIILNILLTNNSYQNFPLNSLFTKILIILKLMLFIFLISKVEVIDENYILITYFGSNSLKVFLLLFCILSLPIILNCFTFQKLNLFEYFIISFFVSIALTLLLNSNYLFMVYLLLELKTLSCLNLGCFHISSTLSKSVAVKYFFFISVTVVFTIYIFFNIYCILRYFPCNLVVYCDSISTTEVEIAENVLDYLLYLWVLLFNIGVLYSITKYYIYSRKYKNFEGFIPFLLFILILLLVYNSIGLELNIFFGEHIFSKAEIMPENLYAFNIILFLLVVFHKVVHKLSKFNYIQLTEYTILLCILFLLINIIFLTKENLSQYMEIVYHNLKVNNKIQIQIIYICIKVILLCYVFLLTVILYITHNWKFFRDSLIEKKIIYTSISLCVFSYCLKNNVDPISLKNFSFMDNLLNLAYLLNLVFVLSIPHFKGIKPTCNNKRYHLLLLQEETFSKLILWVDNKILKRIDDKVYVLIFSVMKKYLLEIYFSLAFMPATLAYIYPLFFLSPYKFVICSIFLGFGSFLSALLSFPTTKTHMFRRGIMCCSGLGKNAGGPEENRARGNLLKAIIHAYDIYMEQNPDEKVVHGSGPLDSSRYPSPNMVKSFPIDKSINLSILEAAKLRHLQQKLNLCQDPLTLETDPLKPLESKDFLEEQTPLEKQQESNTMFNREDSESSSKEQREESNSDGKDRTHSEKTDSFHTDFQTAASGFMVGLGALGLGLQISDALEKREEPKVPITEAIRSTKDVFEFETSIIRQNPSLSQEERDQKIWEAGKKADEQIQGYKTMLKDGKYYVTRAPSIVSSSIYKIPKRIPHLDYEDQISFTKTEESDDHDQG